MRTRKKKLPKNKLRFYSAGMLSILLLPIIFLSLVKNSPRLKPQHGMEINMYHPSFPFSPPFHRKAYNIPITGDSIADKHGLYIGQIAVHMLKQNQDTINQVRFTFSDKAKYWSYVEVLNICMEEKIGNYAVYKNDIWVYYPYKPKRKITHHNQKTYTFVCGTSRFNNTTDQPIRKKAISLSSLINYWPSLVFLILMIVFFLRANKILLLKRNIK